MSPHSDDDRRPPSVGRRRLTTAIAVLAGLSLGLGAALVGSRLLDGDDAATPAAGSRDLPDVVDGPDDLLPDDLVVPPGAGAESAEDAVTGFLAAEVDGDFETSFGYLADAGRATFGSPAGWVAAHADELPPITGFELGEQTRADDDRETFSSRVEFTPGLDQVIGLVPAQATVTWDAVRGADGSWGVSLDTSAFLPEYPSDAGVPRAVERWLDARLGCETPGNERPGLVGSAALADQLCDVAGDVTAGDIETLDEIAAQPIFTAFGDETVTASRLVRISGAVDLAVVLAPIGDEWTVIGILP